MKIHYLGTTEIGIMVAKQTGLPTVMIRRTDAHAPTLHLPHTRVYHGNPTAPTNLHNYPDWRFDPLTLFCTDTIEEAVQIIEMLAGERGLFAVAIDATGEVIISTFNRCELREMNERAQS